MRIQRGGGGRGAGPPLVNKKNIGFLAILVPIPLKSKSYQASFQFWAIIGMPAKLHLNGISLMDQRGPAYSGIWIIPPTSNLKKRCQGWTLSDKTFWIRASSGYG